VLACDLERAEALDGGGTFVLEGDAFREAKSASPSIASRTIGLSRGPRVGSANSS